MSVFNTTMIPVTVDSLTPTNKPGSPDEIDFKIKLWVSIMVICAVIIFGIFCFALRAERRDMNPPKPLQRSILFTTVNQYGLSGRRQNVVDNESLEETNISNI
jgi:hypothetical protein